MTKRERVLRQALKSAGIPVTGIRQTKHLRVSLAGCRQDLIVSATPSDRRSLKNVITQAKRLMQEGRQCQLA